MPELLHDLIDSTALRTPDSKALLFKENSLTYSELANQSLNFAKLLLAVGLTPNERVGIYLPKMPEAVVAFFGASKAAGVFVPINPLLKPAQVSYILQNCNVRVLVTSDQRLHMLKDILAECHDLRTIVLTNHKKPENFPASRQQILSWPQSVESNPEIPCRIDMDMAAILYTSGSTGNPKGVVLSHRNMVTGAKSVSSYLKNTPDDRLLAVLPFSFDYGLSQLTTAFLTGAAVVLMEYLLPRDIINALERYEVTGLAAVPPIWNQISRLDWPSTIINSLRYITNSGGAMPKATTMELQKKLPSTSIFLMYGLTEAFRSTYLPPEQISNRPDSIGKAIPNAEIMVVREDGSECSPGEPGELVHRGSLVAMGYWNDPEKTAERFKPCPMQSPSLPLPEMAVWSGDQVKRDKEGYLYFISRKDEMIKTMGYRVSPTEVEEVVYGLDGIRELAAVGLPHAESGQAILLLAVCETELNEKTILSFCQRELPNFMVPKEVKCVESLPRNQNGKIDRKRLSSDFQSHFDQK